MFYQVLTCILLSFTRPVSSGLPSIGENDLALHLYTPEGQVAQLAYASRSVERSPPRLSFIDKGTGIVASFGVNDITSKLRDKVKPILEISPELSAVYLSTGYCPDVTYLLDHMNEIVQNHCMRYGESPNVDFLAYHISNWITRGMYKFETTDRLSRPLATATAIAAFDKELGRTRLLQVDNTGYVCEKPVSILGNVSPVDQERLLSLVATDVAATETIIGIQDFQNLCNTKQRPRHESQKTFDCKKESWLATCGECLKILVKAGENDCTLAADQFSSYILDCCLIDARGNIFRTQQPLRSVLETCEWLKTISSDPTFVVYD